MRRGVFSPRSSECELKPIQFLPPDVVAQGAAQALGCH